MRIAPELRVQPILVALMAIASGLIGTVPLHDIIFLVGGTLYLGLSSCLRFALTNSCDFRKKFLACATVIVCVGIAMRGGKWMFPGFADQSDVMVFIVLAGMIAIFIPKAWDKHVVPLLQERSETSS